MNMMEHKYLFSSPARIIGSYKTDLLDISGVTSSFINESTQIGLYAQNFYTIKLFFDNNFHGRIKHIPHKDGDIVCMLLSAYFGKTFYYHGLIQSENCDYIPNIYKIENKSYQIYPYSNIEDKKLNFCTIPNLDYFFKNDDETIDVILAASAYFAEALRIHSQNKDLSYLNLVATGEILSNIRKYSDNEIFNEEILDLINVINNEVTNCEKYSKILHMNLKQIKRKYCIYLKDKIDDNFYFKANSYSMFTKENIDKMISSSYDLRSQYIHAGKSIGQYVSMDDPLDETCNYIASTKDKRFNDLVAKSPTFYGLYRIIHNSLRNEIFEKSQKGD